jgi:hypothetical protein
MIIEAVSHYCLNSLFLGGELSAGSRNPQISYAIQSEVSAGGSLDQLDKLPLRFGMAPEP